MEEQNEQCLEIIETWEEIEVLIRQNKDRILSFNLKKKKKMHANHKMTSTRKSLCLDRFVEFNDPIAVNTTYNFNICKSSSCCQGLELRQCPLLCSGKLIGEVYVKTCYILAYNISLGEFWHY